MDCIYTNYLLCYFFNSILKWFISLRYGCWHVVALEDIESVGQFKLKLFLCSSILKFLPVKLWSFAGFCSVLWKFSGCRPVWCWQYGGLNLSLLNCKLYNSEVNFSTCCWWECGLTGVLILMDASMSRDDASDGGISFVQDEVGILHTSPLASHHCC